MNEKNNNKDKENAEVGFIPKISPIDQWMGLSNQLNLHKRGNLLLGGLCAMLILVVAMLAFQNPIVAVINEDQRVLLKAFRKSVPIGENEIKRVVKEFIKQRYEWEELDPLMISRSVAPLVTNGLKEKLHTLLIDLKENGLQGKKASQQITEAEVTISENSVLARFDKVLRVEGIPLIIPTGISLLIVKGARTFWNPEGIYINGVLENANK